MNSATDTAFLVDHMTEAAQIIGAKFDHKVPVEVMLTVRTHPAVEFGITPYSYAIFVGDQTDSSRFVVTDTNLAAAVEKATAQIQQRSLNQDIEARKLRDQAKKLGYNLGPANA